MSRSRRRSQASARPLAWPRPGGASSAQRYVEVTDDNSIALIGLMGTGKSTIGRIVAARLDRRFLDNDVLLLERFGASASDLRNRIGVTELHRLEREVLSVQLEWPDPSVINVAASVVDDEVLRQRLRAQAFVVWLHAAPAILAARVATGPPRPRLTADPLPTADDIEALAARRHEAFAAIADLEIDTTSEAPDRSAHRILVALTPSDAAPGIPHD